MRETFPYKVAGDRLGVRHLNKLSEAARRMEQPNVVSYAHGHAGVSSPPIPWAQRAFKIVSDNTAHPGLRGEFPLGEAKGIEGLYEIRPRYWRRSPLDATEDWRDDTRGEAMYLDSRATEESFAEEEIVTAYWDGQAGVWVPTKRGAKFIRFRFIDFVEDSTITANCLILSASSGDKLGEIVEVTDATEEGCFFTNETEEELENRNGYAVWMKYLVDEELGTTDWRWEVPSLCCPPGGI